MLTARDPLSERVHLKAPGMAAVGTLGIVMGVAGRFGRMLSPSRNHPRNA